MWRWLLIDVEEELILWKYERKIPAISDIMILFLIMNNEGKLELLVWRRKWINQRSAPSQWRVMAFATSSVPFSSRCACSLRRVSRRSSSSSLLSCGALRAFVIGATSRMRMRSRTAKQRLCRVLYRQQTCKMMKENISMSRRNEEI